MIQPKELTSDAPHGPWSCRGTDIWDALRCAESGDAAELGRVLARDPNLYRAEYWYTQPIHLAVRGGHLEAVRVLLEAGADPGLVGLTGEDLLTAARDRGHAAIVELLEAASAERRRSGSAEPADHPIHTAVLSGQTERVREILDERPELVDRPGRHGGTPLHLAVSQRNYDLIDLLLARGADIDARHGPGPASERGYAPVGFEPIDLAFWSGAHFRVQGGATSEIAHFLLDRGATYDLTIAAALGDYGAVDVFLEDDPARISEARPCGKRPLSSAIELGHESIVRLLLDHGADPNWPEGAVAPRGLALHRAASSGNRHLVRMLLRRGADPNATLDGSGSATYVAKSPSLRELMIEHGGRLAAYDLIWLGDDEEAVRRVAADPAEADYGCGGVFAAACVQGKRKLAVQLLDAGARVPPVVTACRSYLLSDPEILPLLLESGMDPDLPNWQRATPLHDLCGRDSRGRPRPDRTECARILLDAGASIHARDEEYRSTPLAWATRRGHQRIVEILRRAGATA